MAGFIFPRLMPVVGAAQQHFEVQRVDYLTAEASGRVGSISAGQPVWGAEWTLGRIGPQRSDEWRAWVGSMAGAGRTFYGYDVERLFPREYPDGFDGMHRAGGAGFDGSLTSWVHSVTADDQAILQMSGLPAGFEISTGDYVSFRWTTLGEQRRALVRSLEDATASAMGVVSVAILPALPALTPAGAIGFLNRPNCIMRLVPQETRLTPMDRRRAVGGRIVAIQDLRP